MSTSSPRIYPQEPVHGWNRKIDVDYADVEIFGDDSAFRACLNSSDQRRQAYGHFDEAFAQGLCPDMTAAKLTIINDSLDRALRHLDSKDIELERDNFIDFVRRNDSPAGFRSLMLGIKTAKGRDAIPTVPIPDDEAWMEGPEENSKLFVKAELHKMLDYAERQLLKAGEPFYQMGERLVHPVEVKEDSTDTDAVRRSKGAMITADMGPLRLLESVIEHVKFHTIGVEDTKKEYIPTTGFTKHMLARPDRWQYPILNGIVECPTLRRDGSLIDKDGYDEASCLIVNLRGQKYPKIPDQPTQADAHAALAILKKPFELFPYVDGASASVMIAAVLTGVVRRTLHSAPMFGFDAPTPGTGKSLAIDCISMIVTGHAATILSQGASEEEDEKRIFAALLKGDQTFVLDNVTRPINGTALCSILTQPRWSSRVLGESRNIEVPCNVLAMSNGNNLKFIGDMTRRVLLCRMDAGVEHPETRTFDVNLHQEIPRKRPQLVAAALTILRAFIVAGYPGSEKLTAYGSFEGWSRLVRGALVWLGQADPLESRKLITGGDTGRADFGELLRLLGDAMGDDWWTVGDLMGRLDDADKVPDLADAFTGELKTCLENLSARISKAIAAGSWMDYGSIPEKTHT